MMLIQVANVHTNFISAKNLQKNYIEKPPSITKSCPVSQLEASLKR